MPKRIGRKINARITIKNTGEALRNDKAFPDGNHANRPEVKTA